MNKVVWGVVVVLLSVGWVLPVSAQTIAILNSDAQASFYMQERFPRCTPTEKNPIGTFLGITEHERYFLGWHKVLADAVPPIPHSIIKDIALTDGSLANIDILILSNDPGLSVDQTRAVHQWVLKGGRLIATFGSGYNEIVTSDPYLEDPNKGHTDGLHELWHDPMNKVHTSELLGGLGGVDITRTGPGPTDGLARGSTVPYWGFGNILTQRPVHHQTAFGFLNFDFFFDSVSDVIRKRTMPAILRTTPGKGQVVYYAFAPEFFVAYAYDLAGHCANDPYYHPGASGTNSFHPGALNPDGTPRVPGSDQTPLPVPTGFVDEAVNEPGGLRDLMLATVNYMMAP